MQKKICKKIKYPNVKDAVEKIKQKIERGQVSPNLLSVYKCPHCHKFHLTSKTRRGRKRFYINIEKYLQ